MSDSLMYSETAEHLANLDRCGSRELRRGYLAIVLAATRAGYHAAPRPRGKLRELLIRDNAKHQPFAMTITDNSLLFDLRRPALAARPELAGAAQSRFDVEMAEDASVRREVRITLASERDAEDLADWLFGEPVTP